MALIHYVCNLKDARGNLLPLEQRSLGDVYKILAYKSVNEINRVMAELPPEHPAKGPHGLFLKARENLWGNIIGLGNRLAVFQNPLVDKITRNHDVDLLLPGQKPCAYFVIISAQDSAYRFLSSLFFSLTFPQLSNYARLHGGRLPVLTNFCLEEYLNIGYMEGISDVFNSIRGFNMSVQVAVQSLSQWQEKYPGKGAGDMICCLDESGSTAGECAAWGKAVAMTLLEIAESEGRKFALIHFSGPGSIKTDLFLPKQTQMEDKLLAAETFLDGGTDFRTPLDESLRLMRKEDFDNADIVFITDGECALPPEYISELREEQSARRFTITGILLDQGNAGMNFCLKPFCQNIYRTSELTGEQIVKKIALARV